MLFFDSDLAYFFPRVSLISHFYFYFAQYKTADEDDNISMITKIPPSSHDNGQKRSLTELPDPILPEDFDFSNICCPIGYDYIEVNVNMSNDYFCWKQGKKNPGMKYRISDAYSNMRCTNLNDPLINTIADVFNGADYFCASLIRRPFNSTINIQELLLATTVFNGIILIHMHTLVMIITYALIRAVCPSLIEIAHQHTPLLDHSYTTRVVCQKMGSTLKKLLQLYIALKIPFGAI